MVKKCYSAEFKELIEEKLRAGVQVSQLARENEPSAQTLYKWKRGMVELNGVKADNIEAEPRRLKRENRQLREDIAILEKAAEWIKCGLRIRILFGPKRVLAIW